MKWRFKKEKSTYSDTLRSVQPSAAQLGSLTEAVPAQLDMFLSTSLCSVAGMGLLGLPVQTGSAAPQSDVHSGPGDHFHGCSSDVAGEGVLLKPTIVSLDDGVSSDNVICTCVLLIIRV